MTAIRSLKLENIRGIARGELDGFAPLTILTGPNNCGKSTILDALAIAAAGEPLNVLGEVVRRRKNVHNAARWFLYGADAKHKSGVITLTLVDNLAVTTALSYTPTTDEPPPKGLDIAPIPPFSRIILSENRFDAESSKWHTEGKSVRFTGHNEFWMRDRVIRDSKFGLSPTVRLIDPAVQPSLQKAYAEAFRRGQRHNFLRLLNAVDSRIQSCDVVPEEDGTSELYLTMTGSLPIPMGLAGDGIQTFAQLALELASSSGELVLAEEPEVCLHPRAIHQAAVTMRAAVRRGIQLVITTHSLELIDALVAEESDLDQIVLFNLALDSGSLKVSRYPGKDVAYNREVIANDLR